MQKKLIALAVAGLISGGAFAQSNVVVYGIVDVAVDSVNLGDGSKTRISSGGLMTERLGFRGTEALGNGLNANFNLEMGLGTDRGTNTGALTAATSTAYMLFDRLATLGLSGNWGSLNVGRQYSPSFNVKASSDAFNFAGVGTNASMWQGTTRVNNSVRYDSPSMSGFTFAALYGMGDQGGGATNNAESAGGQTAVANNKNSGRHVGLNLRYANGPVSVGYGYGVNDSVTLVGTNTVKTKTNNLAATYDFGVAKLWAGWNTYKNDAAPVTVDNRVYSIAVTAPVGAGTVKVQYGNLNEKLAADTDTNQWSLGYVHPMSKRTNAYATWTRYDNKGGVGRGAAFASGALVGNGAAVADTTYDPSALQVGLNHSF